ncbi:MAG: efflux RND transporter periplasmic adaptor subunit [Nitrospirota bacterium]
MKKKIIIVVIAILVISGIAAYRYLTSGRNNDMLELSGTVEVTEVNVGFKMPGRIAGLHAEEGQRVSQGDRLADLDSAELRSIVEQGRAAVRNAEAEYEKARKDHDRYQALSQEGAVTTQQLDLARKTHDVAQSQVDQARAALRTAEVRLKDTVVDAPVSGIVLSRNVEQGETVAAGGAVYTLGDLDNPWIKVYVNETRLGQVKLGQQAQVFSDTYSGKAYEGRITYIASEAEFTPKNVQTREERVKLVFGVKVSVKNEGDELKPGMPADVKIRLK